MFHVQFSDGTDITITSVFGGPQDPEVYANLGEVEKGDDRLIAFWASLPEEMQPRN